MNILLIFFAIPVAVIILSIILETFIKCPIKVAGIFFAIFLVIAFLLGGCAELIVAAIVYTIISFIAACLTEFICSRRGCIRDTCRNFCRDDDRCNNDRCEDRCDDDRCNNDRRRFSETEFELSDNNLTTRFSNRNNCCRRCR